MKRSLLLLSAMVGALAVLVPLGASKDRPTRASLALAGAGAVSPVRHIYWPNYIQGSGSIGRADLDGSNVSQSFITGNNGSADVAVDSSHVYWTNYRDGEIGRTDLDGSNASPSFITGAESAFGVAVDAG